MISTASRQISWMGILCWAWLGLLVGCAADNPGSWPQEKVAAKIAESLELTEVSLAPGSEGGYEGQGTRADGETLTFTITQDAAAHRLSWDATGDRGFVEEGFYELK